MKEITLTPTKQAAPKIVGYLVALGYLGVVVCFIMSFVNYLKHNTLNSLMFLIIMAIVIVALIICSKVFAWESKSTIKKKGDTIIYEVYDIVDDLNSGKTTYKIENITGVSIYKGFTNVRGDIKCKEPMQREKKKKSVKINYSNNEVNKLLEEEMKKNLEK